MALKYPKNPRFNKLQMRSPDYATWQEGCAHDPSLLEWEGRYYVYSTDTFGAPAGYQIRVSDLHAHGRNDVLLGTPLRTRYGRKILALFLPDGIFRRFKIVHRACKVGKPARSLRV